MTCDADNSLGSSSLGRQILVGERDRQVGSPSRRRTQRRLNRSPCWERCGGLSMGCPSGSKGRLGQRRRLRLWIASRGVQTFLSGEEQGGCRGGCKVNRMSEPVNFVQRQKSIGTAQVNRFATEIRRPNVRQLGVAKSASPQSISHACTYAIDADHDHIGRINSWS